MQRARLRLAQARVDGIEWYWPPDEMIGTVTPSDTVHLVAPFDPVGGIAGASSFSTGSRPTPPRTGTRGYCALPLLRRDRAIGWGNISLENGALHADVGYIAGRPPRERRFTRALDAELERLRAFLRAGSQSSGSQAKAAPV